MVANVKLVEVCACAALIEVTRALFATKHVLFAFVTSSVETQRSFYVVCGSPFCLSCQSVGGGYPAMPTLELVDSNRVVVRAFAPSPQTLARASSRVACQFV